MMKIRVLILAALAMAGVLSPASAQPPEPVVKSWHVIEMQHMRPGYIAWWLDPKHNPEPFELIEEGRAMHRWVIKRADPQEHQEGIIAEPIIPKGIEIVIGVDARNELLAFGTESDAKELRKKVTFLDRPQPKRQVEIAGYEVEMDAATAKSFGIDFTVKIEMDADRIKATAELFGVDFDGKTWPYASSRQVREDFKTQLDALVAQGKAQILQEFSQTTLNNVAVRLGTTTITPVRVHADGPTVELHQNAAADAAPAENPIYLAKYSGLTVEPYIRRDDLIDLSIRIGDALSLRYPTDAADAVLQFPLKAPLSPGLQARSGVTAAIARRQPRSRQDGQPDIPERVLVYFITPRIIEPVEEK